MPSTHADVLSFAFDLHALILFFTIRCDIFFSFFDDAPCLMLFFFFRCPMFDACWYYADVSFLLPLAHACRWCHVSMTPFSRAMPCWYAPRLFLISIFFCRWCRVCVTCHRCCSLPDDTFAAYTIFMSRCLIPWSIENIWWYRFSRAWLLPFFMFDVAWCLLLFPHMMPMPWYADVFFFSHAFYFATNADADAATTMMLFPFFFFIFIFHFDFFFFFFRLPCLHTHIFAHAMTLCRYAMPRRRLSMSFAVLMPPDARLITSPRLMPRCLMPPRRRDDAMFARYFTPPRYLPRAIFTHSALRHRYADILWWYFLSFDIFWWWCSLFDITPHILIIAWDASFSLTRRYFFWCHARDICHSMPFRRARRFSFSYVSFIFRWYASRWSFFAFHAFMICPPPPVIFTTPTPCMLSIKSALWLFSCRCFDVDFRTFFFFFVDAFVYSLSIFLPIRPMPFAAHFFFFPVLMLLLLISPQRVLMPPPAFIRVFLPCLMPFLWFLPRDDASAQ